MQLVKARFRLLSVLVTKPLKLLAKSPFPGTVSFRYRLKITDSTNGWELGNSAHSLRGEIRRWPWLLDR